MHLGGTYAAVVVFSLAVCAVLILLLRPLLARYALARPNARSSHVTPTPQGGGIAVITATVAVATVTLLVSHRDGIESLALVFAETAFVAAFGAVDDIRTLAVLPRLLLQLLAVGAIVWTLPDLRILPLASPWLERALLLICGLWFVNLVNFMDGIDWMVVAEVIPITAALAVLGLTGVIPPQEAIVAVALGGAILGFAPFNRPVAKLFLGDVGSLPIGLLLGWLLALLAARGHLMAALLLPLYFVADATITLLRRIANREPFWQAHRNHFYQRAVLAGAKIQTVIARVFVVNIGLAALAIASAMAAEPLVGWIALAAGVLIVGWLLRWMTGRT